MEIIYMILIENKSHVNNISDSNKMIVKIKKCKGILQIL